MHGIISKNAPSVSTARWRQEWSYILVAGLFAIGIYIPQIGLWTNPVSAAWFVGTQPRLRGFLVLLIVTLVLSLSIHAAILLHDDLQRSMRFIVGGIAEALPFLLYRQLDRNKYATTLSLPLWTLTIYGVANAYLPPVAVSLFFVDQATLPSALAFAPAAFLFTSRWLASTLVWFWKQQAKPIEIYIFCGFLVTLCESVVCIYSMNIAKDLVIPLVPRPAYAWIAGVGAILLQTRYLVRSK